MENTVFIESSTMADDIASAVYLTGKYEVEDRDGVRTLVEYKQSYTEQYNPEGQLIGWWAQGWTETKSLVLQPEDNLLMKVQELKNQE